MFLLGLSDTESICCQTKGAFDDTEMLSNDSQNFNSCVKTFMDQKQHSF